MDPIDFRRRPMDEDDETEVVADETAYKPYGETVPLAKGISDKPIEQDLVKDYITKKYSLGDQYKQLAGDNDEVKAARTQANKDKKFAGIMEGVSTIFAGGKKTDSGFYNGLRDQADSQVTDAEKDREHRLKQFLTTDRLQRTDVERGQTDAKYADDRNKDEQQNDPTSESSKTAQELATKMFPGKDWSKMTAAQWQQQGGQFKTLFDAAEQRKRDAARAAEKRVDQEISKGSIADTRARDLDRKLDLDLDKKALKYSATLEKSGIPGVIDTIENIDRMIGAAGKDLPGVGMIEGALPDVFAGDAGRDLRQEVSSLFNKTLHVRSGSAVTDQELQRLRTEFGNGAWKTEKQFKDGIRRYKERLQEAMRNLNAGSDPKAIDLYTSRGGTDFRNFVSDAKPGEQSAPKEVKRKTKDGRTAVFDEATKSFIRYED